MLSALIPSEHSYPAVHLVVKPVDQRFVQPGPLVLGSTSLKHQRLQQIETNLSHACYITYYYVHGLYHLPKINREDRRVSYIKIDITHSVILNSLYGVIQNEKLKYQSGK